MPARALIRRYALISLSLTVTGVAPVFAADPVRLLNTPCSTPAVMHCPDANCGREIITNRGPAVVDGRNFFLDYPCDLKSGEKVTLILSLHGAGSSGNWQRHYFPLLDYKDKYRLVIATPTAATAEPTRVWVGSADDEYLQHVVTALIDQIGKQNVKAFWLVGHSQGGATSSRLVCSEFFRTRIDGFLSLSGGRIGGAPQRSSNFQNLAARGAAPAGRGAGPGDGRGAAGRGGDSPNGPLTCDYSHIYETGEHEIVKLPDSSTLVQKYSCEPKPVHGEVVDTKAGYVYDGGRQNPGSKGWGLLPRPGKADSFVYKGCKDGRVIADVVRLDKGHTEGLEPKVTDELVQLLVSARGGKLQTR